MNSDYKRPLTFDPDEAKTGIGWIKIAGIIVLSAVIATLVTIWVINVYLFPSEFNPVSLNQEEKQLLDDKIKRLEFANSKKGSSKQRLREKYTEPLTPEPYTEEPGSREIVLTEKELNSLLANNTDLARKLAIDLSDGMASAKLLLPLDEELPIFGGRILRVTAGLKIDYADTRPVIALKGVSVWGIPVPNAWLGNMKNIDLVKEFGTEEGFWKSFAEGIERIEVKEKKLRIRLKE